MAPATGDPAVPVAQVFHAVEVEAEADDVPVAPATGKPPVARAQVFQLLGTELTIPATEDPGLPVPTAASGEAGVGTTVLVMGPVGTGIVTVTVTGVAAQPDLHTVSVV